MDTQERDEARDFEMKKTAEKKGFFKKDETIIIRNTCFKVIKAGKGQMTLKLLREETRMHRREQSIGQTLPLTQPLPFPPD